MGKIIPMQGTIITEAPLAEFFFRHRSLPEKRDMRLRNTSSAHIRLPLIKIFLYRIVLELHNYLKY